MGVNKCECHSVATHHSIIQMSWSCGIWESEIWMSKIPPEDADFTAMNNSDLLCGDDHAYKISGLSVQWIKRKMLEIDGQAYDIPWSHLDF